jgi:hypothetical protein
MEYTLLHKNIAVLNFELDNDFFVTKINDVYSEQHAPVGILNNAFEEPVYALRSWWGNRAIPASRQYLKEALEILRIKTTAELLSKCHGLSLSDHYWVRSCADPEHGLKWEDINFFENDFSEDIGKILTGSSVAADIESIDYVTPDGTTDGWLPKKWVIENNERYLIKGGSETFQQEPFNEVLASSICDRLGINHAVYTLKSHNSKQEGMKFYSACRDIVNVNTELVSAFSLFRTEKPDNNTGSLTNLFNACEKAGMNNIENIKSEFSKMSVLDYLIANTDRHLNNFGFLRNPDTLEWIGLAPVYDSGTSLFCRQSPGDLKNPARHDSEFVETKPFAKTLPKQFDRIIETCGMPELDFSKLSGIGKQFAEQLEKNPQNEGRSELLGRIIDDRIEETQMIVCHPGSHNHPKNSGQER